MRENETYEKIQRQHPTNAIRLIHTSVKLDTICFPRKEIVKFHGELGKSLFCQQLLKHLVDQHFYLFHTDYKIKQAICEELGIKFEKLRALEHVSQAQKRVGH